MTMRADGSRERRVLGTPIGPSSVPTYPDFSPSGDRIVFADSFQANCTQIYVIPATGGTATRLREQCAYQPSWQPLPC